jgi:hypothetical protein
MIDKTAPRHRGNPARAASVRSDIPQFQWDVLFRERRVLWS